VGASIRMTGKRAITQEDCGAFIGRRSEMEEVYLKEKGCGFPTLE